MFGIHDFFLEGNSRKKKNWIKKCKFAWNS